MNNDEAIERRIVTGLIISTDYIRQLRELWKPGLLKSKTARVLSNWCIEYFDRYKRAPGKDIEGIFLQKLKGKNLTDEQAEDVEDILDSLSEEYERADKFNVDYLLDQTNQYFEEQNLTEFSAEILSHIDRGDLSQARNVAGNYTPVLSSTKRTGLDFSNKEELENAIEKAFTYTQQPVIKYPRQFGEFINDLLVRDSLVGVMGSEKRGKTFWLLEFAMRAVRQRANVAFFEAGDMSEAQITRRISIYLTKQSDKEKYSGKMFQPVRDCILNQMDLCDSEERESDHGIFEVRNEGEQKNVMNHIRYEVTMEELQEKYKKFPDYKPCYNCQKYWKSKLGAIWIKYVDAGPPLEYPKAQKVATEFFINQNRHFKLACYPSYTLTVKEMETVLDTWEKEGFIPDVIVGDYPDIFAPEIQGTLRDQENHKWARLRGLSEKKHCLVLVGTQADAASYKKNWLHLDNFSEDKRKYGHVTAMIGLNQDPNGREKKLKIMRLNKLVVREEDFISSEGIVILQNLYRGQPYLSSFFT